MAAARRSPPRLLGDTTRRKLEVASAMAWEALVDAHVAQARQFIALLATYESIDASLPRYLREMDLDATMAAAIHTRVLTAVEDDPPAPQHELFDGRFPSFPGQGRDDDDGAWTLLRQPQRVVRGVIRRQKRGEEIERITQLALARAEEKVIRTHIENAIGFVALLEDRPFDRSIEQYLSAVSISGSRAQAVFQRTMARLADAHLGGGSALDVEEEKNPGG